MHYTKCCSECGMFNDKINLKMTDKEFRIIGHSLGVKIDKYNGDKKLPKEYYRNYYQAGEGHDNWNELLHLVKVGLMTQREQFDMPVFHVTDEGKERFRLKFVAENRTTKVAFTTTPLYSDV